LLPKNSVILYVGGAPGFTSLALKFLGHHEVIMLGRDSEPYKALLGKIIEVIVLKGMSISWRLFTMMSLTVSKMSVKILQYAIL